MTKESLKARRELLNDVRSHIRGEYHLGYLYVPEWHSGKGEYDKKFGNVTVYLVEPGGLTSNLAFRYRLSENYAEEIEQLKENCREYIDKLIALKKAEEAVCNHAWPVAGSEFAPFKPFILTEDKTHDYP